ncbi:hypothetical protein HPB48_007228 [Haemaphysalis longicornis]|uniref:G-protein coupled receptors family 1 profile domain-containing protein n=1 Tax=Haemaphysalis longicornis TaxID=44386 RepID=A0A9J6GU79_HAELO|nr:hypothetical protein HPB48_007228 [Haemaphysalis longicornis]
MDDARRRLLHRAKMKSLMITVVIVAAFIVCWTPYYCMMIIFIFLEPDDQLTEELQAGIFFFGSSTAMINPLIYGVFHLRHHRRPSRGSRQYNSSAASRAVDTMLLAGSHANRTAPAGGATLTVEGTKHSRDGDSVRSRTDRLGVPNSAAPVNNTTACGVGNGCAASACFPAQARKAPYCSLNSHDRTQQRAQEQCGERTRLDSTGLRDSR